jgi:hypothetical protein
MPVKWASSALTWMSSCSYTVLASGCVMLQYGGLAKMPYTFTDAGYANMHFTYGFCNGNRRNAVVEHQQCYPHCKTFNTVHRILRETGSLPQVNTEHEQQWFGKGDILVAVKWSPSTNICKISMTDVAQTQMQRIMHHDGFYPYHLQRELHLLLGDNANQVRFCE